MAENANIGQMLAQMKAGFNARLDRMDTHLKESTEKYSKLERRVSHPKVFSRKGNEHQHTFNSNVFDAMEDAQAAIAANKIEKTSASVQQGIDLLKERQKMILLADSTSWEVVQEYNGNDVASDTDDEGKIRRAQSAVERRRKSGAGRGTRKRGRGN